VTTWLARGRRTMAAFLSDEEHNNV